MRRRPVIFREAPRFLAVRQEELRRGIRPIRRTVLTYGPVLSLLGLWFIHQFAAVALTPALMIGLFLAPLGIMLPFEIPALLSHMPALRRHFLNTWRLTRHGVVQQSGYGAGASRGAWSNRCASKSLQAKSRCILTLGTKTQSAAPRSPA